MNKYRIGSITKDEINGYRVIIGADFVPTESNRGLVTEGRIEELMGSELYSIVMAADYRIFNLEAPITDEKNKIKKEGSPNLKIYRESTNIFSKMYPMLLASANNHIRDYGEKGITDTIDILRSINIDYVGFGKKNEVKKIHYQQIGNVKIGVYAFAENEYSVATEYFGGANGFDECDTFDEIAEAAKSCAYLIVLFHGGCENYRYPSPNQMKICRKLVDKGADLVVCQHSHCIGTYESYGNGIIVYGQGNFLFDALDIEEWKSSVLLEVDFCEKSINFIPVCKIGNRVRLATNKEAEQISQCLLERCRECRNHDFVKTTWGRFAEKQQTTLLLRGVLGKTSPIIFALNKVMKGKLLNILVRKKHKRLLYNYLRGESIRERILYLLKEEEE